MNWQFIWEEFKRNHPAAMAALLRYSLAGELLHLGMLSSRECHFRLVLKETCPGIDR